MGRVFKEIQIANILTQRHMYAPSKLIQNAYDSMRVNYHMNFAQKPPESVILEWYFAICDPDKDIDYFHTAYKHVQPYLQPKVEFITLNVTVKKPEDDIE